LGKRDNIHRITGNIWKNHETSDMVDVHGSFAAGDEIAV
jgi:hypothetical protein